jgi:hypothetical protein
VVHVFEDWAPPPRTFYLSTYLVPGTRYTVVPGTGIKKYKYNNSSTNTCIRRDHIGIGDDKENKKHALGARRLADKAALDHAFMMRASRLSDASFGVGSSLWYHKKNIGVKLLVNQK